MKHIFPRLGRRPPLPCTLLPCALLWCWFLPTTVFSQDTSSTTVQPGMLEATSGSELRDLVDRYSNDRRALARRYDIPFSAVRRDRLKQFEQGWLEQLENVDFEQLGVEGRIDWVLLRNRIELRTAELDREAETTGDIVGLVPFAPIILGFQDERRERRRADGAKAAEQLEAIAKQVEQLKKGLDAGLKAKEPSPPVEAKNPTKTKKDKEVEPISPTKIQAHRAARMTDSLVGTMARWNSYFTRLRS